MSLQKWNLTITLSALYLTKTEYRMKTTTPDPTGLQGKASLRKILLYCGILGSLLYTVMMIVIRYEGYSLLSHTVSELSAIGAPTRPLWTWLGIVYQVLMIAFGLGVLLSAGRNRALRVVGWVLLFVSVVVGSLWYFGSMHQREVLAEGGATTSDTIHLILAAATVISNLLIIGFGAAAFGKRFRLYSIITLLVLLVFGILTAMDAPRVQENLPTPWAGLWERINIVAFYQWIVVLAVVLLRDTAGVAAPSRSENP